MSSDSFLSFQFLLLEKQCHHSAFHGGFACRIVIHLPPRIARIEALKSPHSPAKSQGSVPDFITAVEATRRTETGRQAQLPPSFFRMIVKDCACNERSAKPLFGGSIPPRASSHSNEIFGLIQYCLLVQCGSWVSLLNREACRFRRTKSGRLFHIKTAN